MIKLKVLKGKQKNRKNKGKTTTTYVKVGKDYTHVNLWLNYKMLKNKKKVQADKTD